MTTDAKYFDDATATAPTMETNPAYKHLRRRRHHHHEHPAHGSSREEEEEMDMIVREDERKIPVTDLFRTSASHVPRADEAGSTKPRLAGKENVVHYQRFDTDKDEGNDLECRTEEEQVAFMTGSPPLKNRRIPLGLMEGSLSPALRQQPISQSMRARLDLDGSEPNTEDTDTTVASTTLQGQSNDDSFQEFDDFASVRLVDESMDSSIIRVTENMEGDTSTLVDCSFSSRRRFCDDPVALTLLNNGVEVLGHLVEKDRFLLNKKNRGVEHEDERVGDDDQDDGTPFSCDEPEIQPHLSEAVLQRHTDNMESQSTLWQPEDDVVASIGVDSMAPLCLRQVSNSLSDLLEDSVISTLPRPVAIVARPQGNVV